MSFLALGITAAVIALTAGTLSTISAYQQGRAQEEMYKAEANMARQQAQAALDEADKQAELAQDQAAAESKKLRRQQLKAMGNQTAALGAMGIEGVTAEDIIADTTKIQNDDTATLRWNADTASWEAKAQGDYNSWQFQSKAALANQSAKNTRKSTNMGVYINILNTASSTVGAFASVSGAGGGSGGSGGGSGGSGGSNFSSSYKASGGSGLRAV